VFFCIKNQCVTAAKRHGLLVVLLCSAVVTVSPVFAQSINIVQVQPLTFPTLGTVSGGGSVNLSINPLNSTTSGTAEIVGGLVQRGQYALSLVPGGTPLSISVDISGVSTGNAGLTLDNFSGCYKGQSISFPSSTLALPASSPASTPLFIGARITANSTVGNGSYSPSFTINVYIQ
jgi:Domain of unknown function (DUF4402)